MTFPKWLADVSVGKDLQCAHRRKPTEQGIICRLVTWSHCGSVDGTYHRLAEKGVGVTVFYEHDFCGNINFQLRLLV
jgi:hypothetical protein